MPQDILELEEEVCRARTELARQQWTIKRLEILLSIYGELLAGCYRGSLVDLQNMADECLGVSADDLQGPMNIQ